MPRRRTVKKVGATRCGVSTVLHFARCACQRHCSSSGTEDDSRTAERAPAIREVSSQSLGS